MSKWLLVRHGETTWNALGKIQGHEDVKLSGKDVRARRRDLAAINKDHIVQKKIFDNILQYTQIEP